MARIHVSYKDKYKYITVVCVTNKLGNFTKDKVYYTEGTKEGTDPNHKVYSGYRFKDDEGDTYTLGIHDINSRFRIIERRTLCLK